MTWWSSAGFIGVVWIVSLGAGGCGLEPQDPRPPTVSGKLTTNGLVLNSDALRQLSAAPLNSGAPEQLVFTEPGRELLRYVAVCALPAGAELVVDDGVREHAFAGALGLAPEWEDGTCGPSCRRWVSACLIAHANVHGVEVPISLRAHHPALGASDADHPTFTLQEGAFYGDVFAARDGGGMYACIGDAFLPKTTESSAGLLPADWDVEEFLRHRLCFAREACPIQQTGPCNFPLDPEVHACDDDGTAFGACHTAPPGMAEPGDDAVDTVIDEVITVYLESAD